MFFPCDQNKLQAVYNGIAGNVYWDFVSMAQDLNWIKGEVGFDRHLPGFPRPEANLRYVDQLAGPGNIGDISAQSLKPLSPLDNWNDIKEKLSLERNDLQTFVLGCDIWTSDYVLGPLDRTNNRIYNSLYVKTMPPPSMDQS